VDRR